MDTRTNHLVTQEALEKMEALERARYTLVPKRLRRAATKKLAGRSEATVSRRSGGKLSQWAAEQRRKQQKAAKRNASAKAKNRRRMAKDSRRRNRSK